MKKLLIATVFLLGTTFSGFAQSHQTKVIALVNKASWCPVCQANGPRFMKNVMPMAMKNKNVQVVMDDLSNEKTKAASLKMLEKAGIADFAKENTATGMLYFIDANTKQLISKVSIAKSNETIEKDFKEALMRR